MPNAKNQRQRIVDDLRDRILKGKFKPGEPLRQIPLSQEFGVAQGVIREALRGLEQLGLVNTVNNLGVFVRDMGPEALLGAYQVREVLEGLAAKLCCRTVSRADIEWFEAMAEQIHTAKGRSKRRQRNELEHAFHHRFLELSGNESLLRMSDGYRFVGDLVVTDRDPDELLKEHLAIVNAVATNKPEKAERMARQHVVASADSIRNQAA
ncbi:MAG: GntR family transcriptional regulator [Limisphaerales bacterium]